jgi:hypothetical protein
VRVLGGLRSGVGVRSRHVLARERRDADPPRPERGAERARFLVSGRRAQHQRALHAERGELGAELVLRAAPEHHAHAAALDRELQSHLHYFAGMQTGIATSHLAFARLHGHRRLQPRRRRRP